jgi:acyl dehydratase
MSATGLEFLTALQGHELGPGEPVVVSQERVDAFADCTLDSQWIHVDRERAAEGPFGGTIAHGYLTLSLLVHMLAGLGLFPDGVTVINYGLDRLRFPAPLPSGSAVRLRARVAELTPKGEGRVLAKIACEVRADGADAPALVADVLYLYVAA